VVPSRVSRTTCRNCIALSTSATSSTAPLGARSGPRGRQASTAGTSAAAAGGHRRRTSAAQTPTATAHPHTVARLPTGTRYAGVAALGPTIYVAGGLTTAGATSAVYAVSLNGTVRRVATLPVPEDHAALAALGGTLFLVGGRRVLAIDPGSGKVTVAARLPARLSDPTATTVGNRIVIAGGGTDGVWNLGPG